MPDPLHRAAEPVPSASDRSSSVPPWRDGIELGPVGLGLVVSPTVRTDPTGALVREAFASPALEGPPGVLQGGFASLLPALAARLVDAHGAPLTALTVRLRAPTPLGRRLDVAVRPFDVAHHAVSVEHEGRTLVTAEVEFAGAEAAIGADLVALARSRATGAARVEGAPGPGDDPHPTCFVCGSRSSHPLALHLTSEPLGDEAAVTGWVADEALAGTSLALVRGASAEAPGVVDELVLAAVLDCVSARAALPVARASGHGGVVLGSFALRSRAPVPVVDPVRVVARVDGRDGRRIRARVAVVDDEGAVAVVASVVHVAVPEMPALRVLEERDGDRSLG